MWVMIYLIKRHRGGTSENTKGTKVTEHHRLQCRLEWRASSQYVYTFYLYLYLVHFCLYFETIKECYRLLFNSHNTEKSFVVKLGVIRVLLGK